MKSRMPGRGRGGRAHFETVAEEPARVGRRAERVAARVILLLCVRGPMVPHPVVPARAVHLARVGPPRPFHPDALAAAGPPRPPFTGGRET